MINGMNETHGVTQLCRRRRRRRHGDGMGQEHLACCYGNLIDAAVDSLCGTGHLEIRISRGEPHRTCLRPSLCDSQNEGCINFLVFVERFRSKNEIPECHMFIFQQRLFSVRLFGTMLCRNTRNLKEIVRIVFESSAKLCSLNSKLIYKMHEKKNV